mmetsp:Transcript_102668/g.290683  ORF Transcript_102668/g.290683 Transcript_102668/m.290683 type:complete len:252 (-) Transcript_102668:275-1030(-)
MATITSFVTIASRCRSPRAPELTRMWVRPISFSHSSLTCSGTSICFATRAKVEMMSVAEYPCFQISWTGAKAAFQSRCMAPFRQPLIFSGWGWSFILKTYSRLIMPKALNVDWAPLSTFRMSPSAEKMRDSSPDWSYAAASCSRTYLRRSIRSSSAMRLKRKIAHRDWIGSMILEEMLQASAKRVVVLYISMVLRIACCAAFVMLSASSRMMTLSFPSGRVTFCCAKPLIFSRTTSMPRSSEAFSSMQPVS